jgi:hypothetical protein
MSTPIIAPPPGYQWETNTKSPLTQSITPPSDYQWEPQGTSRLDTSNVPVQPLPEGISADELPTLNRGRAIINALQEGNVKDLLGNAAANAWDSLTPTLEGAGTIAGGEGVLQAGKALMKGSLRPALGIGAGIGAYGLTNDMLEKIHIPWYLRHAIAFPVGAAAGGAVAPEAMEGVKSIGGIVKKIPSLFMNQSEEQGASKVVPPPRITYRPEPPEVKPPPVKMRDRSYLTGGEEEFSVVPKGAINKATLDDIAKSQDYPKFDKLNAKQKETVMKLYDLYTKGQSQ